MLVTVSVFFFMKRKSPSNNILHHSLIFMYFCAQNNNMRFIYGIIFAALSSATFGLAPIFSITLLSAGYSSFEVLFYRWGIAALFLFTLGFLTGCNFKLKSKELKIVLLLCFFRASTSLSLLIAYQNIASGIASTIHFMYPLAVTLAMIFLYKEKRSATVFLPMLISVIGAVLLTHDNINCNSGDTATGIIAACISVVTYSSYIIGVLKTNAANINSTVLTSYVMGIGAVIFGITGLCTKGIRLEASPIIWLYILGLALPATAISNITLVLAVKRVGPTLTSILGVLEPLTAVLIGVLLLDEKFTWQSTIGIIIITIAVTIVILQENTKTTTRQLNVNNDDI